MTIISIYRQSSFYLRYDNRDWKYRDKSKYWNIAQPYPTVKTTHLITHFQFTFCELIASSPGLGYILIYVGHQNFHSGQTNNKPQFHSGRSGVTLYQGAPGSKFSKAPLVEVLKARVDHRICTSFLGGPGHVRAENFWIYTLWNAISWTLGRDFTEFWWSENDIVTYQRPWPMFLLYRLNLGAPIWTIEVGGPRVLPVWAHSSYATVRSGRMSSGFLSMIDNFTNGSDNVCDRPIF
jgi:hypothetical protein